MENILGRRLNYPTVMKGNALYYRIQILDADGQYVDLYAKTPEELFEKELNALSKIEQLRENRNSPTVAEYCEKWLYMQSAHVRETTLIDYRSKVKRHIIAELGEKLMVDVSLDDIRLALVPVANKSCSVYKSVCILYKNIFTAAANSGVISKNPTLFLDLKGGVPQNDKEPLTDHQVAMLVKTVKGLPPYEFVMLGLYAGLRREEILALKWDCVHLEGAVPYLEVKRAWHTEHNRPVILDELKTPAANREIPLPDCLLECLREAKEKSFSDFVVCNSQGEALSYTQFKQLWKYITVRSAMPRTYYANVNGTRTKRTLYPKLGEKARNNGHVVYTLDFKVTPHQLRHTYITNLIHASVDPKTVQYLAGHQNSKITMDIYAKVKYNRPEQTAQMLFDSFEQLDDQFYSTQNQGKER